MDLEAELDRLYSGPAAEFVAERNKLVQALRKSGDKARAGEIARRQRPTPAAHAVNRLHFRDPGLLRALREAGLALREAQESADVEAFTARQRAHQAALGAATERAMALVADDGGLPSPQTRRRIETTLTALSTAIEDVTPPPGRMAAELEPLGFDAFTSLPAPAPKPAKRTVSPEDAARAETMAKVKDALGAAEKELRRLEHELERSRAILEAAERDLVDAERRTETARNTRDDARRAADESAARVETARHDLETARRALEEQ